jgi:hypothetical protein
VPAADKVSQRHIAAFAKAAKDMNVRILLESGLRIAPYGTVDRPRIIPRPSSEAKPPTNSEPETPPSE